MQGSGTYQGTYNIVGLPTLPSFAPVPVAILGGGNNDVFNFKAADPTRL